MCTMIVRQVAIAGSGKGAAGWFQVRQANVSYDHPFHAPLEHALNLDFVDEAQGPGARVAVELTAESARHLVEAILGVLAEALRASIRDKLGLPFTDTGGGWLIFDVPDVEIGCHPASTQVGDFSFPSYGLSFLETRTSGFG